MELTYTNMNGFQIPNLTVSNQPTQEIGEFGRRRRTFLQENDPLTYEEMLMNGTLFSHLLEVETAATQMYEQTMAALLKQTPKPDRKTNPLGWTQWMNSAKMQAEELIKPLLYAM